MLIELPNDGNVNSCQYESPRYLSDGLAVGSQGFVDGLFEQSRELFGAKRKSGARVIREVKWKEKETRLYTMRQLKKDVIE